MGITLPALPVPDGRLHSRHWRPVAAAAVVGPVLGLVGGSLIPGQLQETVRPIDNPFGLAGVAGTVATVIGFSGLVLWAASLVAALVSLGLRLRASRGTERQQLRWVVAGAAGAVAGLLVGMAGVVVTYFAVLCVPVGWRWRCCATGCGTWTGWSAGPSPTRWSSPCWPSPTC